MKALSAAKSMNAITKLHEGDSPTAREFVLYLQSSQLWGDDVDAILQSILDELVNPTLAQFVATCTQAQYRTEQNQEGCVVTTIHKAKGREFDTVVVPAVEEGVIPSRQAMGAELNGNHKLMSEEARLLFVAATRARRDLILTWSRTRMSQFGKKIEQHEPSRFLAIINPE